MEKKDLFFDDRLANLQKLRDAGVDPYPYSFESNVEVREILADFPRFEGQVVRVWGRLLARRTHGKSQFLDLRTPTGDIQLYCRINELQLVIKGKSNAWDVLEFLETGDLIGVEGKVFRTRMGEISVHVDGYEVLCKALYPIPFGKQAGEQRWYSVTDPLVRYKERYIYWNVYPEETEVLRLRARVTELIRAFMNGRDFVEVDTPAIEMIYGGAEARPFETSIWALGRHKAYLRISPELYLKRYIVGGVPRVYTICHNFRNEGIDASHNPEFTMMEWYEACTDYNYQMTQFEDLVSHLVMSIRGSYEIDYQGTMLDFRPPWKRLRIVDALREMAGLDAEKAGDDEIKSFAKARGVALEGIYNRGVAIAVLFDKLCSDHIVQPTFVIDHPVEISPLTKEKRGAPGFVERFEPVAAGMELGNAYSELTDPVEQFERFHAQRELGREEEGVVHHPLDWDFLKAISCGMPPTGGVGLGLDRVVMLIANRSSIRDVIPYPMMKAEEIE
jgi:lysyl-tRNA synthetase class 2